MSMDAWGLAGGEAVTVAENRNTMKAYVRDGRLILDPPVGTARSVRILLEAGVRVAQSGMGERLLYRGKGVYGLTLEAGLAIGWCTLQDTDS